MERNIGKIANASFALALIVLAVNAWVSYHNIRQMAENQEWVQHTHQDRAALDGVLVAMTDAETGQRGYLLTGDPETLAPYHAAPMHDIGKIGIRDLVLLKPGKLDDDEIKIMRQHVPFGGEIIGEHADAMLSMARLIALTHHEKWDRTGYHRGLKGEEIPLVGRITSIADVFDALTSVRPYKKAWPVEDAVKLIQREVDTSFDPELVQKFVAILPQILAVREKYSDAPHVGH